MKEEENKQNPEFEKYFNKSCDNIRDNLVYAEHVFFDETITKKDTLIEMESWMDDIIWQAKKIKEAIKEEYQNTGEEE